MFRLHAAGVRELFHNPAWTFKRLRCLSGLLPCYRTINNRRWVKWLFFSFSYPLLCMLCLTLVSPAILVGLSRLMIHPGGLIFINMAHPDMPINLSSEPPHLRGEAVKSSQRHAGEQMRGGITAC